MLTMETIFHKYGGVEIYVHELSKHFVGKGHRVFVVSMSTDSYSSFIVDGVNYITVPIKKINIAFLSYSLQMFLFNVKAAIAVKKLNQKYNLNVIHAQFCCGFFYSLLRLFWRDNAKFVVTLHGTMVDELKSHIKPIFLKNEMNEKRLKISSLLKSVGIFVSFFPLILIEYASLKFADGIIASSYDTLRNAIRYYRIEKKIATVIYSGVNFERFKVKERERETKKPQPDKFTVLYVGRADERKGIQFLIEAASILISKHQNIRFFLVGPRTEKYSLRPINQNLKGFLVLTGKVSEQALTKYYLMSDVFVLPSLYEGFGLVVIEAFAAGKPVIAFKVGSLPELIQNGENGILLKAFDVNGLARAIETLMKNNSLRMKMGFQAKETAKKFTWSATSNKTMNFYMKIPCTR
jgi:glycosyltransferase involved in cell wall biosynthesis